MICSGCVYLIIILFTALLLHSTLFAICALTRDRFAKCIYRLINGCQVALLLDVA